VQAAHAVLAVKGSAAAPLQRWHARVAGRRGKKTICCGTGRRATCADDAPPRSPAKRIGVDGPEGTP